jgi:hypothetical protein
MLSLREVTALLLSGLPPGIDRMLDVSPGSDLYRFFEARAVVLKRYGFDLIETLRMETDPSTVLAKIPEWEAVFGVTQGRTARYGGTAARRDQILSRIRELGSGSTRTAVQTVLAPLLGYENPSQIEVLEPSRGAVTFLNTTSLGALAVYGGVMGDARTALVRDRGKVSAAGASVTFRALDTGDLTLGDIFVTLTAPDSTVVINDFLGIASQVETGSRDVVIRRPVTPGSLDIYGDWTLTLTFESPPGVSGVTATVINLIVEGIGRDAWGYDGLGSAIYRWSALVDPALAGVTHSPDYTAARSAVGRIAQSHTIGGLARRMSDGSLGAIAGDANAIAGFCVCGSPEVPP